MGVPTWRYSAGGHIIGPPIESGVPGLWLRSPAVERLVESQVKRWLESGADAPASPFPGCLLVPMVETHRRRRRAIGVAMVLSPSALATEEFHRGCQTARLDAQATRSALAAIARIPEDSAAALGAAIQWMHADLQSLSLQEQSVAGLSRQLAESYEEITLLYKLGQSMNEVEEPLRFVKLACDQLHTVLSFGWIAAYFLEDNADARTLRGQLVVYGAPPCDEAALRDNAARVLRSMDEPVRLILDDTNAGQLLKGGSQVLVHPVAHAGRTIGALFAGAKNGEDTLASNPDMKMLDAAAGYLGVLVENARLYDDQQAMFMGTLEALTTSIDAKDPYTCGHSERVAHLSRALALEYGLSHHQSERIHIAGLVHDLGKIGVPETVLCKPGKLTPEEFGLIKRHPDIGAVILKDIPLLDDVLPGVLHHHERYDGKGYPGGLKGEEIPLMARIIGLADSFDAMSSNRTYRAAMTREKVLAEIQAGAGTQFDPELARAFLRIDLKAYDQMVARHHEMATSGDDRFGRPAQAVPRHAQQDVPQAPMIAPNSPKVQPSTPTAQSKEAA